MVILIDMDKPGFVIEFKYKNSTLYYDETGKCCRTDLRLATIYGDEQSAQSDINCKEQSISQGKVITYDQAKSQFDESQQLDYRIR